MDVRAESLFAHYIVRKKRRREEKKKYWQYLTIGKYTQDILSEDMFHVLYFVVSVFDVVDQKCLLIPFLYREKFSASFATNQLSYRQHKKTDGTISAFVR